MDFENNFEKHTKDSLLLRACGFFFCRIFGLEKEPWRHAAHRKSSKLGTVSQISVLTFSECLEFLLGSSLPTKRTPDVFFIPKYQNQVEPKNPCTVTLFVLRLRLPGFRVAPWRPHSQNGKNKKVLPGRRKNKDTFLRHLCTSHENTLEFPRQRVSPHLQLG